MYGQAGAEGDSHIVIQVAGAGEEDGREDKEVAVVGEYCKTASLNCRSGKRLLSVRKIIISFIIFCSND